MATWERWAGEFLLNFELITQNSILLLFCERPECAWGVCECRIYLSCSQGAANPRKGLSPPDLPFSK